MEKHHQKHKRERDHCHPVKNTLLAKSSIIAKQQQIFPSPSLVRRARVIRRRTTNVYYETLKRLKEEDAVLIDQILLISLKPRSEATEYECSCSRVSGSTAHAIPSVDFAFPSLGSNASQFPPPLFYPDFMRNTVQRKEEREAFQVVLTNEKGERTFAFCFKFLSCMLPLQFSKTSSMVSIDSGLGTLPSPRAPYSVLVFVSRYPRESLFHELASDFVNMLHKDNAKLMPMCRDLLQLRLTNSEKSVRLSKYVLSSEYSYNWSRNNVSTVVEKVGVENAVFIFLSMLAERRVLVTGTNVSDVSRTVQAFVLLLAPLEWPHTLIPIVPDSQTELCSNPTPYICGILRYNLSRISELLCPDRLDESLNEDVTVVDVERGVVIPALSRPDKRIGLKALLKHTSAMGFPQSAVCDLLSAIKSCLPVKDPEQADYKIQKKVMIWYAKLFGHYRTFGQGILSARNRKLFARAHPCAETRLFLKWFVENGILQSFIFSQSEGPTWLSGTNCCSRFQKVLKKYAPPVSKEGKRKRTKSILWKVFTA